MKGIIQFILASVVSLILFNRIEGQTPARTIAINAISDSLPNNNTKLIKPSSLRFALFKMLLAVKDSTDIITIINLQKNIPSGIAGLDGAGKVLVSQLPTETDPTVSSTVKAITSTNISNWNAAFGWGNHSIVGYLTPTTGDARYALLVHTHVFSSLTGITLSSLADGQVLKYNSATSSWNNWTITGFATTAHTHALSDLSRSGADSAQVPVWNGFNWVPRTPSVGGGGAGTVTSFSKTNGYGILMAITNPTTIPNLTTTVDTTILFPAIRATIPNVSDGNYYIDSAGYSGGLLKLRRVTLGTLTISIPAGRVDSVGATNSTGITWTITNPTTTPNLSLALTAAAVGLSNVNNTSDANKPVSTAQAAADALRVLYTDTATMLTPYLRAFNATTLYVSLTGSYSNPSWITALDAAKLNSGLIPSARYGAATIPTTAINASSAGTGKVLSYDLGWIANGGIYTNGYGLSLTSNVFRVDTATIASWLSTSHPLQVLAKMPLYASTVGDTVKFNRDSSGLVRGLAIRSGSLYDTIAGVEVLVGVISGSGNADYTVATAVNTTNYTTTTATYVILPDLTGQANRTVALPSSPTSGRPYIYDNTNDNASGFTWTFSGGTIKDNAGNTITTLGNKTLYHLVYTGTNYRITN